MDIKKGTKYSWALGYGNLASRVWIYQGHKELTFSIKHDEGAMVNVIYTFFNGNPSLPDETLTKQLYSGNSIIVTGYKIHIDSEYRNRDSKGTFELV